MISNKDKLFNSNKSRKSIGLALGSGGWRGMAHVGVIKALVENNIPIDYISGSSAGSLIGGLYSCLLDVNKLESIILKMGLKDLILALRDTRFSTGIIKGERAVDFLKRNGADVNIQDLKIPFTAIATNLPKGEYVILERGNLAEAIMTSSAIPLLFEPKQNEDMLLVDGAISMPLPVNVVREMGADIVIGVDLYTNIFPMENYKNRKGKVTRLSILKMSYQLILSKLSKLNSEKADIVITPKTPEGRFAMIRKFATDKSAIRYGYEATIEKIDEIKKLSNI